MSSAHSHYACRDAVYSSLGTVFGEVLALIGLRPFPLQVPSIDTIPLPSVRALERKWEDTHFITGLARNYAQSGKFDETLPHLLSVVWEASGSERDVFEEHAGIVAKGILLGLGLAKAEMESISLKAGPGLSHPIVHNAVCRSTEDLPDDIPGEIQALVYFAVRVGYYIGKRGDPALLTPSLATPAHTLDREPDASGQVTSRLAEVERRLAEAEVDPRRADEASQLIALRDHLRSIIT